MGVTTGFPGDKRWTCNLRSDPGERRVRSGSPPRLQPGTARDWGGLTGPESQGFLEPVKTRMGESGAPKGIVPSLCGAQGARRHSWREAGCPPGTARGLRTLQRWERHVLFPARASDLWEKAGGGLQPAREGAARDSGQGRGLLAHARRGIVPGAAGGWGQPAGGAESGLHVALPQARYCGILSPQPQSAARAGGAGRSPGGGSDPPPRRGPRAPRAPGPHLRG